MDNQVHYPSGIVANLSCLLYRAECPGFECFAFVAKVEKTTADITPCKPILQEMARAIPAVINNQAYLPRPKRALVVKGKGLFAFGKALTNSKAPFK